LIKENIFFYFKLSPCS